DYGRLSSGNEHQFMVDGQLVESDVVIDGTWRNVIVGTLGAGGKGLYVLDVTNFNSLGANSVLWDATLPADEDVGHILSQVQVGMLPDGRWMAFTGNGYDSTSGRAALLMYNLSNGELSKLAVGDSAGTNGLGGVHLVRNASHQVVGVYAGDLQGQLWRFEWAGLGDSGRMQVGYGGKPFFRAQDAGGQAQAITAAPSSVPHASRGRVVVFG